MSDRHISTSKNQKSSKASNSIKNKTNSQPIRIEKELLVDDGVSDSLNTSSVSYSESRDTPSSKVKSSQVAPPIPDKVKRSIKASSKKMFSPDDSHDTIINSDNTI